MLTVEEEELAAGVITTVVELAAGVVEAQLYELPDAAAGTTAAGTTTAAACDAHACDELPLAAGTTAGTITAAAG